MAVKGISILLVEDEPLTQEVTTHYLQHAGFTVHCAATGEEALAILRQEGGAIDWLLTDINLPGSIDGWIVGAEFHLSHPLRPVVYTSAFAPHQQAHPAGGVFVSKPYSPAAVVELLGRLAAKDTSAAPDRRLLPRVRSLLGARLHFGRQFAAIDCTIRDISESGARLALEGSHELPEEFELQFLQARSFIRGRLVWRRTNACGIKFLYPFSVPSRRPS
jgi:two-component system, OmpR family, response regulator